MGTRWVAFVIVILAACGSPDEAPPIDAPAPIDAPVPIDGPDLSAATRRIALIADGDLAIAYLDGTGTRAVLPVTSGVVAETDVRWARCGASPDGSRIAAISADGKELRVAALGATGPGPAVVVSAPLPAAGSLLGRSDRERWSPDSRWLLYAADAVVDDAPAPYAVDLGGAQPAPPVPLVDDQVQYLDWFADSTHLIASRFAADHSYLTTTGATTPQPLAAAMHLLRGLAPAPVGTKLAYATECCLPTGPSSQNTTNLYVLDTATAQPAQQLNAPLAIGEHVDTFAWSPDGNRLAFAVLGSVYTADLSGPGPWAPALLASPGGRADQMRWSPDGAWLAYSIGPLGAHQVFVARADGTGTPTAVGGTVSTTGADIAFAPTSRWLTVVPSLSVPRRRVFAVPLTGTVVGAAVYFSAPEHEVYPMNLDVAEWAPDGTHYFYAAYVDGDTASEVRGFVVDLGGSAPSAPLPVAPALALDRIDWTGDGTAVLLRAKAAGNVGFVYDWVTVDGAAIGPAIAVDPLGRHATCAAWIP